MLYICAPNETLHDIVYRHYGPSGLDEMVEWVAGFNRYYLTQRGTTICTQESFQAIFLPDHHEPVTYSHQLALDEINSLPYSQRHFLWDMVDDGIDPNYLIATCL